MTEITAYHMLNGAIVIGVELATRDDGYSVSNAVNLLVQQEKGGNVAMGIAPMGFPFYMNPKDQPKTFDINRAAVAYTHKLDNTKHADILKSYKQTFSSIILNSGLNTGINLNLG